MEWWRQLPYRDRLSPYWYDRWYRFGVMDEFGTLVTVRQDMSLYSEGVQ